MLQRAFDIASVGLLRQGKKSVETLQRLDGTPYTVCRYRGADGCKCAGGFLIPDAAYRPDMEGHMIDDVWRNYHLDLGQAWPEITYAELGSLRVLQSIHDDTDPDNWREHLRNFALQHSLSTSEMDKCETN